MFLGGTPYFFPKIFFVFYPLFFPRGPPPPPPPPSLFQVRGNFRELLQFWQAYYARKDRDRISLAFSSNLPFTVWQEAVDRLQRCLEGGLPCACD